MIPKKILALKFRSLGDTVLMSAPLIELIQAYPHAEIHAAVHQPWVPLLEGIPGLHRIWGYERRKDAASRARSLAALAFRFRKEKYDRVYNFHASPSSAVLAFSTGANTRSIHFHGHHHNNQYSTVEIPGKGVLKPIIERDMDTLRSLGTHVPAGRLPQIFLQPSEIKEAVRFLEKLGLGPPVLALSLGASRPTKSWPMGKFASLAINWCQKEKGSVLAIAGPEEDLIIQDFLNQIEELLPTLSPDTNLRSLIRTRISAVNHLQLRELAAIFQTVSVFAGNDSGPKHVAVAVGTPTVTFFGPEDPFEWHPYPVERNPYFFIEGLACRKDADPGMPAWCGIEECLIEEHQCMLRIEVNPVLEACRRVATRSQE